MSDDKTTDQIISENTKQEVTTDGPQTGIDNAFCTSDETAEKSVDELIDQMD